MTSNSSFTIYFTLHISPQHKLILESHLERWKHVNKNVIEVVFGLARKIIVIVELDVLSAGEQSDAAVLTVINHKQELSK